MGVNNLPRVVVRDLLIASPTPWRCATTPPGADRRPGARSTKYLTAILRLSYDNAKVTINLRQLTINGKLFTGNIHVQSRNIVGDNVRKLACDIPGRNFSTF